MRHKNGYRKLNRTHSHRKAMLANMACALIEHEQITTTVSKAKELRSYVDKIITSGKKNTLHARRNIVSQLRHQEPASKVISVLAERYTDRKGGYTRVIRAGFRFGDNAPLAVIEFVDRDIDAKGSIDRAREVELTQDD